MTIPTIPNRYEFREHHASGGMGHVYRFFDTFLERDVAVKCILSEFFSDRMMDEVCAFKNIRSPHVVETYDIIKSGDGLYILQEFLPGEELEPMADSFTSRGFLRTLYQVASGIASIHAAGHIHRDIKPNNMKFDAEGILNIFDFGLSRPEGEYAKTVGFRGTFGFAAPELLLAGDVVFDKSIDVYAFGVTAYYVATGSIPPELTAFRNPDLKITPFASAFREGLPDEVINILDDCLEYSPANRPKIHQVLDLVRLYLVENQHRALVVLRGNPHYIDKDNSAVKLGVGTSYLIVKYTGVDFVVAESSGYVKVNNHPVSASYVMPEACVISFGHNSLGAQRTHVTFDISQPGVVL